MSHITITYKGEHLLCTYEYADGHITIQSAEYCQGEEFHATEGDIEEMQILICEELEGMENPSDCDNGF